MNTGRCKCPKLLPESRYRTVPGHTAPRFSIHLFSHFLPFFPQATTGLLSPTINYFLFSRTSYKSSVISPLVPDFFPLAQWLWDLFLTLHAWVVCPFHWTVHSIAGMQHVLSIPALVDGLLGCFHFGASVKKASVNFNLPVCVWAYVENNYFNNVINEIDPELKNEVPKCQPY